MTPHELLKRLKRDELMELSFWIKKHTGYPVSLGGSCRAMRFDLAAINSVTLAEAMEEVLGMFFGEEKNWSDYDDDQRLTGEEFYGGSRSKGLRRGEEIEVVHGGEEE